VTRAGALPWIPNSYQWSLTGSLIGKRPVKKRRAGRRASASSFRAAERDSDLPKGWGQDGAFGKGWSRRRSLIGGAGTRRHAGAVEADDCPCDLEQRPTAWLSQRRPAARREHDRRRACRINTRAPRDKQNSRMPRWQARTSGRPIASHKSTLCTPSPHGTPAPASSPGLFTMACGCRRPSLGES
jgi:hypothetical protein